MERSPNGKTSPSILVTGGAGYIGSHTCKAIAQAGYRPVCYDNLIYGHEWAVKWGPLEVGDTADRRRLEEVFARYRPSAVIHFAAYAYVGESVAYPDRYYRNNVAGSLTLLEAMRDHGVDKIVFSSTCSVYGSPLLLPIKEDHPQNPINPYGASKYMVERILSDFYRAYGISSISLRYFNAAGADPDSEIGEDHNPETHLIPLALGAAAGESPITIFGDDYDTPDGTCIRDYVHVTDLAHAHILALKAMEESGRLKAYNLGNGRGYSVKEVIETARSVTGRRISVKSGERRAGDPERLVADSALAAKELHWSPEYSDLNVILETAWRFLKNRSVYNRGQGQHGSRG